MSLIQLARRPAIVAKNDDSVLCAVRKMDEQNIGAIAVMKGEFLIGIFTERDLMKRIVIQGLNPETTTVEQVMTPNPFTLNINRSLREAFSYMTQNHLRHIPIIDNEGQLAGMLSIRHLMQMMAEQLAQNLNGLDNSH